MAGYQCCGECGEQHPDWIEHTCRPERREQHLVNRFRGEFLGVPESRCRLPQGEAAVDRTLLHWRPFGAWLTTHPGEFEVYDAARTRPGG